MFYIQEFQEDTDDQLNVADYLHKPTQRLEEYKKYLKVQFIGPVMVIVVWEEKCHVKLRYSCCRPAQN